MKVQQQLTDVEHMLLLYEDILWPADNATARPKIAGVALISGRLVLTCVYRTFYTTLLTKN